jgi:hypothetical protein
MYLYFYFEYLIDFIINNFNHSLFYLCFLAYVNIKFYNLLQINFTDLNHFFVPYITHKIFNNTNFLEYSSHHYLKLEFLENYYQMNLFLNHFLIFLAVFQLLNLYLFLL